MKRTNALSQIFTLFLSIICQSQVIDLGKCSTDGFSKSGFEKVKDIIGDDQIVVSGEQNLGVRTDYKKQQ
jgi:hypothetical protein